jgi:hypothetical protein
LPVNSEVTHVASIDDSVAWRSHPDDKMRRDGARLALSGDFMRRPVDEVVDEDPTPVN